MASAQLLYTPRFLSAHLLSSRPGISLPTVRSTHTEGYQARRVRALLMMQDLAEPPPSM
jgi:hypothetical protein